MPKKIRELKSDLKRAGFVLLHERGKGSHTVWRHPNVADVITIAGKNGDDAQAYQEKQVREAIRMAKDES